ncbi:MAG: biotin/lipoyl-containing protein, partial [Sneathiella sp.]
VEWQLRVAAGGALPCTQEELSISGHAFEVRLYAEDPANDFLPATGQLLRLRPPKASETVRIDTGVREGDTVSPFYDPMIAKLIVWDVDRDKALQKLSSALQDYQVAGVATNLDFLGKIAAHPAFAAKDLDTGFIERFKADLVPAAAQPSDQDIALAAIQIVLERKRNHAVARSITNDPYSPWDGMSAWRLNDTGHDDFMFHINDQDIISHVIYEDNGFRVKLPSCEIEAKAELTENGNLLANLNGHKFTAAVVLNGPKVTVLAAGRQVEFLRIVDDFDNMAVDGGAGAITAPMPGKVIQIFTRAGATVRKGDPLVVLEAMKMEHTLTAFADGVVGEIFHEVGDQVDDGTILVRMEESEDA